MTPHQSLATLHWSPGILAKLVGRPMRTVQSQLRRGNLPEAERAWLAGIAAYLRDHPAPNETGRTAGDKACFANQQLL